MKQNSNNNGKRFFNAYSSEFKTTKKEAASAINCAKNSIFFWIKNLKMLSAKNEYCDNKSVALVEKAVRNYTKGGDKWDVSIFAKDYLGRFCTIENAPLLASMICTPDTDYITTEKGLQYVKGDVMHLLKPIPMTLTGVFNAFCKVAEREIKALEKAEKEAFCAEEKAEKARKKEAEKAEKMKVRKINELQKALDKGIITPEEFEAKVKAL